MPKAIQPKKKKKTRKHESDGGSGASRRRALIAANSSRRQGSSGNTSTDEEDTKPEIKLNRLGKEIIGPFYQIEYIVSATVYYDKIAKKKKWEYCVKWYNYDESENSAIPEDSFIRGTEITQSFWRNIGTNNQDLDIKANSHSVGKKVVPTEAWVGTWIHKAGRAVSPKA
ncbi:hypothetical protein BKA62DRAFT_697668 [Auriculariales sp. MPI-PUGE-AT-0066]|nr:hypothetical protein BKA62DRAFT_697668 [Auriculariales sp. MPI-PUGE-AT-0066]